METLAKKAAQSIAFHLGYDNKRRDVIAYGLIAVLQMVCIFSIVTFVGILFGFWVECCILYFGVGLLRKSTGGAHAGTMENCMVISVLSIVLLSYAASSLPERHASVALLLVVSALAFAFYYFVAYRKVPVDSPNKPIVKPDKIKRLRRQCYLTLAAYFILSGVFILLSGGYPNLLSFAAAVHFSILWQLMTLTIPGANAIGFFDKALSALFKHR